jgi:hypothetical protein
MTDSLADVLLPGLTGSHDWSDEQLARTMARAAREHIAAEIEARYDITEPWNYGLKYAARIARGQT